MTDQRGDLLTHRRGSQRVTGVSPEQGRIEVRSPHPPKGNISVKSCKAANLKQRKEKHHD